MDFKHRLNILNVRDCIVVLTLSFGARVFVAIIDAVLINSGAAVWSS